jgi:early secretory antigenic target protein ESAT-6
MSEAFEVVTGDLESAAAEVLASAGRLETRVNDLMAYLAPMIGSWSGAAAESYGGVQARWNECAATILEMQRTMGDGLGVIATNYDETEQANTQMWSS